LLAQATFSGETASGWQQVSFGTPVPITVNTTYVASYHTTVGQYAVNPSYFTSSGVTNGPLTALSSPASGGNGVYVYAASSTFPTNSYLASNYWVDVAFSTSGGGATATPTPTSTVTPTPTRTSTPSPTGTATPTPTPCSCSTIWSSSTTPTTADQNDNNAVELGVKFTSNTSGSITGIRFYKGPTNTGTHVASLWNSGGTLLAQATFSGETASGWQQVNFGTPVPITANTTYVASYHTTVGQYAVNQSYFTSSGVTNGPLTALSSPASSGNGVYVYAASSTFPTNSYLASNYWVDVVFH
jgi:hypothetical protein